MVRKGLKFVCLMEDELRMEFIKKLWEEFVVTTVVTLVGIRVIGDIDYDINLSKSYWYAFITHPYRFIKHKGNPIDKKIIQHLYTEVN